MRLEVALEEARGEAAAASELLAAQRAKAADDVRASLAAAAAEHDTRAATMRALLEQRGSVAELEAELDVARRAASRGGGGGGKSGGGGGGGGGGAAIEARLAEAKRTMVSMKAKAQALLGEKDREISELRRQLGLPPVVAAAAHANGGAHPQTPATAAPPATPATAPPTPGEAGGGEVAVLRRQLKQLQGQLRDARQAVGEAQAAAGLDHLKAAVTKYIEMDDSENEPFFRVICTFLAFDEKERRRLARVRADKAAASQSFLGFL